MVAVMRILLWLCSLVIQSVSDCMIGNGKGSELLSYQCSRGVLTVWSRGSIRLLLTWITSHHIGEMCDHFAQASCNPYASRVTQRKHERKYGMDRGGQKVFNRGAGSVWGFPRKFFSPIMLVKGRSNANAA
jgi:hypothetical protein